MRIARLFGIDVILHWSLLAFIGLVAASSITHGDSWGFDFREFLASMFMLFMIFGSVLLHEFGHCLTAAKFGVGTKNILLTPLGGMARLDEIPRDPIKELWISAAGPAVTLMVVAVAYVAEWSLVSYQSHEHVRSHAALVFLGGLNTIFFLFNMLPAFPMDGGRILRSVLAMFMDYLLATRIAVIVSRICATAFLAFAVYTCNIILGIIAIFVFLGGWAEYEVLKDELKEEQESE